LNFPVKMLPRYCLLLLLILQGSLFAGCKKNPATADPVVELPKLTGSLSTLQVAHPRLLLTDARLQELKTMSTTDDRLKKYASDVIAQADKDIFKSPILHVLVGSDMLDKSRECLLRIYDLAFAYRWTGNEKYLAAAESNLRVVCAFSDWDPPHFLDVAEMTHAVAIGYDWLYNKMDVTLRDQVKSSLILLGLHEGNIAYASSAWWANSVFNWNQVCNSGLLIGALAVAETDPSYAMNILPKALDGLSYALKSYGPDGVWGEGPGYWGYATDYTAYGLAALQSALGNSFGLTGFPGMNLTGYLPIYAAGPTGYVLNFADSGEKAKQGAPHPDMWLAGIYNNNDFSDFVHDQLAASAANAYDVIWYRPYANSMAKRDLDKFFGGSVSLYFSRSSWTDPNALWVGFKAGYNLVNHGHLDLGNFEMDAMGVRWARDLGSDDYSLPDYFSGSTQASPRWTYYRLNSLSHSVPVLGGVSQNVDASSKFIKHAEAIAEPFAVVDFTEAYKQFATSAQRGIKMVSGRTAILIQDEFVLSKTTTIAWGMTTDATIQLLNPKQAELTIGGKKLTALLLSPTTATFSVESALQSAPQMLNTGVSRLMIRTTASVGNVLVAVSLSPQWTTSAIGYSATLAPLSKW